jgi:PiT family inorganic phosphate transporter
MNSLIFLSSGLFLGWSLGANNAANFWGTAVGTRMVRFKTAAILCSIFVIIGAVVGGLGASSTLSKLGTISQIAGSFTVALASALTAYYMTKAGIPISTSQAIVGAIIGWNIYSGNTTNYGILSKIASTWVTSPLLTALTAFSFYKLVQYSVNRSKIHMVTLDQYTRYGLILVGIFGSYSLGANNIGNVMGVFVDSNPFASLKFFSNISLDPAQLLFLIGGIAIAVGVFTYSKRVMMTIGGDIFKLSPISALVVVLSVSITMFLFASTGLRDFLMSYNLPTIPLVPVSSSQAIVGAVIGISLARKNANINFGILGKIVVGWIMTPVLSFVIAYISLFFMENVFMQSVY